jgi:hypothetical protein
MGINTRSGLTWRLGLALARRFGRVASVFVLALATQRGALGRHDWPNVAQKQKSPPPTLPGRAKEGGFDATS